MTPISSACFKARSFDGSEALIPASQVFGQDYEVSKSEAWWITAWILERKSIQYSSKKEGWFDSDSGKQLPSFTVTKHIPDPQSPIIPTPDESLTR